MTQPVLCVMCVVLSSLKRQENPVDSKIISIECIEIKSAVTSRSSETKKQNSPQFDLFKQADKQQENGLIAFYNISNLITKIAKLHTIGEDLTMPAAKEITERVLQQSASSVLRAVPLNNDTVKRRIDEMSSDVFKQFVDIFSVTKHSLQTDESTLSNNELLLLGYMRFVHNMQAQKEMLFAIGLPADTPSYW